MKYKKGIHLKTPQDSNYWHFPCVMLCTLPFVVQLQYILQYVKHLKCESGNNSTNQNDNFFLTINNNKTAVPFLLHVLTCTTFPQGYFYWMSEAWVWQYIPGETPRVSFKKKRKEKKNVTQLQLDIFSAFYVLFYLLTTQSTLTTFL